MNKQEMTKPKNSESTNSKDKKITAPEGARYLGD